MITGRTALNLEKVHKKFGALTVTNEVTLAVVQGERRAIIGPNGAGKTTLFNLLSGVLPVSSGQIKLNDKDVTRVPEWKRVKLGLARTFQRNNLFLEQTVFQNVLLAVQGHQGVSLNMFRNARSLHTITKRVNELIEQIGLGGRNETLTANLSYGEQRQLEVALALATDPSILLLDEPTAGMSVAETNRMVDLIKDLPSALTLLIVEHDMEVVFAIADRITVLHLGQVLAEGTPAEMKENQRVREVYLGEE
jgi:branched-chain amino acid transport system ATP-binding protein